MKVKFFKFKSIVTYVTIVAFYWATILSAVATPLRPISLAQMYSLASQGNVRALRAAVQRGMNIDATDRYGNTGLCHAILQRNYTAYNAFHASGANPRHPCIQNIPTYQYDSFMDSSRATPVTATPRDAYKEFADGEFVFSKTSWVLGGLLLAGGITALVLSGSGGGGGSDYYFPSDSFTPTEDSLGALVGTDAPSSPVATPYVPVKILNGKNTEDFSLDNDSQILVDGTSQNLADVINFNNSVLDYSKYLQVGMKAVDANQVVNGNMPITGSDAGATISLKNNTVGMVALHNSNAINNNTIEITAENGTIGIIGSDKSLIRNNGNIDISFKGNAATDQVDAMYVDTSSKAINTGNITGNVTSESAAGTLIGMQARLINQVQNPEGTILSELENNGNITLSATAANDKTISNSLIGMGSSLENDFIDGTKLVRRTGYIEMTNSGLIDLNVSLGDSGTYDNSQTSLLSGTGGIIGMRADAHATAFNNGNINLTIAPESATSINNSHAGMLSVHGGTITNNANITVEGGIGGFGMLGIRGEGTNSEFNTLNPTLINSGTIAVNSFDGIGMATRHGGSVTNNGTIIMGEDSTGLQVNSGTGVNSGKITLNNSGVGMAIVKNTTSEEGTVNNTSTASITNANTGGKSGVITINNADGASGMFIEDGTANNAGTIEINGTASTSTSSSYGIQAQNGTVNNSGAINVDVLLSGDAQAYGIYGESATVVNNSGAIVVENYGTGTYTTSGANTNSGTITMNGIGSTGMASDSGALTNIQGGEVEVVSGTGMQSNTGQVLNEGTVSITNGNDSVGMTSGTNVINGSLNNPNATINMTGANSTSMLIGENGTATNYGQITLTSNKNGLENYGMKSEGGTNANVVNNGVIKLTGYSYDSSKEIGYGMSIVSGEAANNNTITFNQMYGYGMTSTDGTLNNNKDIDLNSGGYGLKSDTGEVFNNTGATIAITGTPTLNNSYGIAVETGTAKNFGTIDVTGNINNDATYGISVNGGNGINHSIINMNSNNAYGLYDGGNGGDGVITNMAGATINLFGNNAYGMFTTGKKAENFGTINIGVDEDGVVTGGTGSSGMVAKDGSQAFNSGIINMNGDGANAMFADGGTVTNTVNGDIIVNGGNGTIFKTSNGGTAINNGDIIINVDNYELFSTTDENGGNFQNTGNITVGSSSSKIIVAGDGTSISNAGDISLDGDSSYIVYASGTGNITNTGKLTLEKDSNNSYGIYMDDTATGEVINGNLGDIIVNGTNAAGMFIASTSSDAQITNKGDITVSGANSVGMGSSNGAIINNSGTITMNGGSAAISAKGGTVNNQSDAEIIVNSDSDADGIVITSDANAATVVNEGTITIKGNGDAISSTTSSATNEITNKGSINVSGTGNAITADSAIVTNDKNATISISGSGYGMLLAKGEANNLGTINVTGNNATAMSTGGVATNSGTISVSGDNAKGMEITLGGTGENSSSIFVSGDNSSGIFVNGGSADNTGTISSSGDGSSAISVAGGNAYNQTTITASGENSIGMSASGGTATNGKTVVTIIEGEGNEEDQEITEYKPGSITVSGTGAIGMKSTDTGSILNNKDASITISGAQGIGMWSNGSGSAQNQGTITIGETAEGATGIKSSQGDAQNQAKIEVGASGASGIFADGGSVTNAAGATITLGAEDSIGILVNSGSGLNLGTLTLTGQGAIGLKAIGGTATNNAELTVGNADGIGLYADGGQVINDTSGVITVNAGQAGILVDSASGNNKGEIKVNTASGILVTGGVGTNSNIINVTGSGAYGMSASGGTANNNKDINVSGTNSFGMGASGAGNASNTGTITVSSSTGIGMFADGGMATNSGDIVLDTAGAKGMVANSGNATNSGSITASQAGTIALYSGGGTVVNSSTGNITGSSASSYLMFAENSGTVENQGTLNFSGSNAAMQANGAKAINSGTITATNGNGINVSATASNGAQGINTGTISISSTNGIGMSATSSGEVAQVINDTDGVINVSGTNGIGMYANGSSAQAINKGTININTTSANAYGMKAVNGGSVENAGKIVMTSGAQGTGIYIGSGSTLYNNASGIIEFTGGETHTGTIEGDPSSGAVSICEEGGACNNKFIYMEQGSTLNNSGTIVSASTLNLNVNNDANLVLAPTSRMIAENDINVNAKVAADKSLLESGQQNEYKLENSFESNSGKVNANLTSMSPMWDVSTEKSETNSDETGETEDLVFKRVAFNNLVTNASQANYLEANYAIRNSVYDGMIIASSQEDFDKAVAEGLGTDLIPNFAKQNMDVMRNVNRQVNNAVFNNTDAQEIRTTVGYDFFGREQDVLNGLSGYEDNAHTGYALFDRQYNDNFRYGVGASVTKYDSDYDNGSERNEVIAQIMTPLLFETENTKFLSMPKVGMGWGEYSRYVQGKEYKADTRNWYYGISNEVRHDVNMGIVTLEPVAEFNVLGFYQDKTKENIRVDSNNNLSIEGGIGLYAKKSFNPMGDDELNVRLGGTYYHEFNNPYQAPEAQVAGLLGTYQMDSYDAQKDRAVLSTRFDYKRGKFNFYLEGRRYIEDDDTYSINAGLTYAF